MPARYYMKSFTPCDLFFIDTNLDCMEPEEMSRQIRDVKKMYRKSRNPWKILCGHHTWRSTGGHGNADDKLEGLLQELFRTCPFDMYVCGHDHCKNHSEVTLPNGHLTHAIVIGTGGQRYDEGPIYEEHIAEAGDTTLRKALTTLGFMMLHATPRKLIFSFHDENGHEEHTATLLKEKKANTKKIKGKTKRMGISRRKRKSRKGQTKSPFRYLSNF